MSKKEFFFPELSIIVPVYKVEKYLSKCIDSILEQTFQNYELILVDDGSPDNCGIICDKYAKTDRRIIVIHQKNKGVSAARNAALEIAKGTFVGFIDADDWVDPDMYSMLISIIKRTKSDISICTFSVYDNHLQKIYTPKRQECTYSKIELIEELFSIPNCIEGVCWNKLFRKKLLQNLRFSEKFSNYEDTIFLYNYLKKCQQGYLISESLYNVLERTNSASRLKTIASVRAQLKGNKYLYHLMLKEESDSKIRGIGTNKYLNDCLKIKRMLNGCSGKKMLGFITMLSIRASVISACILAFFDQRLSFTNMKRYIFEVFFTS